MPFYYDSFDEKYKRPFGCLPQRSVCAISVEQQGETDASRLFLEVRREDGFFLSLPLKKDGPWHSGTFVLGEIGLYFYRFRLEQEGRQIPLGMGEERKTLTENGGEWQISVIDSTFQTPAWCHGTTMYQIFPDRFHREGTPNLKGKLTPYRMHASLKEPPFQGPDENGLWNNDFYGGNLKGIEEKLPYLLDLGVKVIYLNPIFLAFSNHRYDTADYKTIDPLLGNEEDFRSLCDAAHRKGMRIILDGVFSHVGADSIYFDARHRFGTGAVSSPNSIYREWFDFQSYPNKYTCWWNIDTLPCVNELCPSFLRYIVTDEDSVVAHWLGLGADGFRLDVADELPDAFILALRKRMKEIKPDALLIGEVWEDASNKISYGVRRTYFTGGELDSVMNYPFRGLILSLLHGEIDAEAFVRGIMTILEHYPSQVVPCLMNSLSTHDTPRLQNTLRQSSDDKLHEMTVLAAIFLQFTLPGMPCIYYGDEIGMCGEHDPMNRGFFTWDTIDHSLLQSCRSLSALRAAHEALRIGSIRFLPCKDGLHFIRKTENETIECRLTLKPSEAAPPDREKTLLYQKTSSKKTFDHAIYIGK